MIKATSRDFRVTFARMADQAIINRKELAEILSKSPEAVSQMGYRGELPATAFPGKRSACWFVKDVRVWLDTIAAARTTVATALVQVPSVDLDMRRGRPRLPTSTTGV